MFVLFCVYLVSIECRIIRTYCTQCDVVFNELYTENLHRWNNALLESHSYYNVVLDLHLYDWQEPFTSESVTQHIADAEAWQQTIQVCMVSTLTCVTLLIL